LLREQHDRGRTSRTLQKRFAAVGSRITARCVAHEEQNAARRRRMEQKRFHSSVIDERHGPRRGALRRSVERQCVRKRRLGREKSVAGWCRRLLVSGEREAAWRGMRVDAGVAAEGGKQSVRERGERVAREGKGVSSTRQRGRRRSSTGLRRARCWSLVGGEYRK
jgi:hypothetical protein